MAKTTFTTSNALTKKLWNAKLYNDTLKESWWMKFGGGAESILTINSDLTKSKGDQIYFGIRMRLTGTGVTSGMTLEGNEESLSTNSFSVSLEQYRHAVRDNGALDRQRAMFSIDDESTAALKGWGAEKIDQLIFDAAFYTPTKIFYKTSSGVTSTATAATAKAALTAADSKLTPAMISAMKTWAVTGGARGQTPMRPVVVDGRKYFVLVVHPDALYDLKQDSTWSQAMREAEVRGPSNPLFYGSTAIWDNVVIQEHENCVAATDGGGASVSWCKGLFLGAQAMVWAKGKDEDVVAKNFDYDNEHGYAWGIIAKAGKPSFDSKDYACQTVYLACTNIRGL